MGVKLATEKVEVVERGPWDPEEPKFGEYVRVKGGDGALSPKWSLAKGLNGEVDVGKVCVLHLSVRQELKPHTNRDGSLGQHNETKYRVEGVAA